MDLRVAAGEFVVVVGANGSGKSTMLGTVSGSVRLAQGSVSIGGRDLTGVREHRRSDLVAHVVDDPRAGTAGPLDIVENLAFAMRRGAGRSRRAAAATALAELGMGLEERLDDPVDLLSAGQRQALAMAMAGLTRPGVLLLDEHLAALDPRTARRVRDLTVALAARLGCATLMVSHNMRDAVEIGDRLVVLRDGRIVADVSGAAKAELAADDVAELVAPG